MFEDKKLMMGFGFFPGDLRQRASTSDLGFSGFLPSYTPDGFHVSGVARGNLLNLNTTAFMEDSDLGLCQNLSKMSISDTEFLGFSGSRNLHNCSRLDQNLSGYDSFLGFSSRREASLQSSHSEVSRGGFIGDSDYHKLRFLASQDFTNPNINSDLMLELYNHRTKQDVSLIPQKSRLDFQGNASPMYNRNTEFPTFSAMGECFQELSASTSYMKNNSLLSEKDFNGNRVLPPISAMGNCFRELSVSGNKCLKMKNNISCGEIDMLLKEQDFPLSLASIVGIYGSVHLMAKDQMGCRVLQKFIERGSFLDGMIIFKEVITHVIELAIDPFGNYFIQKLIEVCNEEQRTQILITLTSKPGLLVKISINSYGSRVVQKLIETVRSKQQISLVISALRSGFLNLVKDSNGNHVILRCLKFLGPNDNKFVFDAATMFCAEIATNRHGCCVLKHCIVHSVGEQRDKLVAEISRNSLLLAQDPFGNYVLQDIIEQKLEGVNVMSELRGNYVKLATQKFSSHVVEKCLRHYPESRTQIVCELVSFPNFEQLLQDPYANYVIQSALSRTKGYVRASLVEKVRRYGDLRMSPYCKKIFSRKILNM